MNPVGCTGLYIHVPFCQSKCNYCDFYSVAPATDTEMSDFISALEIELSDLPDSFSPTSVYMGGGTPTLLSASMLAGLLAVLREGIDMSKVSEFSVEANPGTLTDECAQILAGAGVSRISIGAQTFNEENLELLGRVHDAEAIVAAVAAARGAGIEDVSLDIMFGIPGGDVESVLYDIDSAAALVPCHVSAYCLSIAPGTRLHFLREQGELAMPEEDLIADQYHAIRKRLLEHGFGHYEISNFAQSGKECFHNLLYWTAGEYYGCGPSAHSHCNGVRYSNCANLWEYNQALLSGQSARQWSESLPPERKARETLVMWLRLVDGVRVEAFQRVTGYDPYELCGVELRSMIEDGLLVAMADRIRLAENSLFTSDYVFREIV